MKINTNSIHFKYYTFLKKIDHILKQITSFSEDNPIGHYLYWENNGKHKEIIDQYKLFSFNFSFNKNPINILKKLFHKILILIFKFNPKLFLVASSFLALAGLRGTFWYTTLPFFVLFPIFTIVFLCVIVEDIKSFFVTFKENKEYKTNLPTFFFSYILFFLFSPILFILSIILEFTTKLMISLMLYVALVFVWIFEVLWLAINFIALLLGFVMITIFKIFKHILCFCLNIVKIILMNTILIKIKNSES